MFKNIREAVLSRPDYTISLPGKMAFFGKLNLVFPYRYRIKT